MSRNVSLPSTTESTKNKRVVSSQLRLAQLESTEANNITSSSSPAKSESELPKSKIPKTKAINRNSGGERKHKSFNDFNLDFSNTFNLTGEETPSYIPRVPTRQRESSKDFTKTQISKEELKKAGELTSIFLDTRKLLNAEYNVIDQKTDISGKTGDGSIASKIKISRGTLIRAEKVKTTLAVKYLYIQRIYEWAENHQDNNEHPGVEGVYNPLQILRNRKLRNKYNEHPQAIISMQTIPLACNVFSKHNAHHKHENSAIPGHRKKHWKMMWAIDLNEFVGDSRWRVNYWHELRDAKGNLWFPNHVQTPEYSEKDKSKLFVLRNHKHHGKHGEIEVSHKTTENEEDQDEEEESGIDIAIESRNHNGVPSNEGSSSDSDFHKFRITRSKSPHKRKIRNKMKKFYIGGPGSTGNGNAGDSSSSSNVANEIVPTDTTRSGTVADPLARQMFKKLPPLTPEDDELDLPASEVSLPKINIEPTSPAPNIKGTFFDDEDKDDIKPSIKEVEFLPFEKRESTSSHSHNRSSSDPDGVILEEEDTDNEITNRDKIEEIDQVKCAVIFDEREMEFQNIVANLEYFHQFMNLRTNYLTMTYPRYLERVDGKVQHITKKSVYEILLCMSQINDEHLPAYEQLYLGFMEEIKSVIHMVNDVYSVKIDTLLSSSDRSISEINASLSLDLRKITEKLDQLDFSLNKNIFKKAILKRKGEHSHNVGLIYKILYSCLENIIVVLLRVIWIVVNIYKFLRYIVKLIFRILKFIVW